MNNSIDILMITYNRPRYTELSLKKLLETCNDNMRVWVWQNGNDRETIKVVETFHEHPKFYKYHHSYENKKLNEPTNWLWTNSDAGFFAKVDDDCIVPYEWGHVLRKAHNDIPELGVVGCWHFHNDDFYPEYACKKIKNFNGQHQIMRNCWIGGSGYLMKRECFEKLGPLNEKQSFTDYCIRLAKIGYIIGWYYPFLYQEHLDDPRCSKSLLKEDADIQKWAPLSAIKNGVTTISAWEAQLKKSAINLQCYSYDPKYFSGWRRIFKSVKRKFKNRLILK